MSSVNVIPSAPEYTETLYPSNEITQINAEDFRLKKISDQQTELKMRLTTTDRSPKNIKGHIIVLTSQLWVLVRFLLGYHQQHLQQP